MKFFNLFIGLLLTSSIYCQTILLNQNFNNGFPSGWQMVDNDGLTPFDSPSVNFIDEAFVITENYDSIGIGDQILVATSWFENPGTADDFLILPKLTMGAYGNFISFDAKSVDASNPDGLEVRISKGGVELWEFFIDEPAYQNYAMSPYWTNYTVSLDSLNIANEDIFITFRHTGYDGFILALDNIKVYVNDPVSITESNLEKIKIAPNPFENFLNINVNAAESLNYSILDISGKTVIAGVLNTNQLDLSQLESGMYLLIVEGYKIEKIIKK
jgi:hypothetical protein